MPRSCARPLKVSGIDGIALTKLDVLDGFKELKVCVGYMLDGERLDRLPASSSAQARVQPIYETFEGWSQSTRGRALVERICRRRPSSTCATSKS